MGQLIGLGRDSSDEQTSINTALKFLETAYKTELATEKNFYKTQLLNNDKIPKKYKNKITKLISEDSFDYITFINILKEIELGEKQWKKQISEIKQQAQHFNEALYQYENLFGKFDMRTQGDEAIQTLIGQLYRNREILYREDIGSMQRALHRSKTFSNAALGSIRSEDSKELIELIKANFNLISNNTHVSLNLPQKLAFITEMALQIAQEVYSIQENQNTSILDIEVAKQLIALLEKDEKTPIDNVHIQNIHKKAEQLLDNLNILEQQGKQIMPETTERVIYNSKKNTLTGLTKDLRIKLSKILNDENLEKLAQSNFTGKNGEKNKQKFIKRLKEVIKKETNTSELQKAKIQRMTQAQLAQHINEILSTRGRLNVSVETEFSSARTIDAIFNSNNLSTQIIGALNGKADSIHLGVITGEIDIPDSDRQRIIDEVMEIYENTYKLAYQDALHQLQSHQYNLPSASKTDIVTKQLFQSSSAYSTYADNIANEKANKIALEELQKRIIDLEHISDENKEKMIDLSSIFKIENSVKYARYYLNDWGFHGGSLGAALPEQLINFENIMSQAGISNSLDIDWLTFAILNAGDGMIGNKNKTAIEDYLSAFASLLMFRTGGELAKQVKHNMENYIIETTNTMHLYSLQTVYVPASYILKTTYDALQKAYNLIQSTTAARGSQVLIINPVNFSNKINNPPYSQRGQAWYQTAAANFGKVTLNERLMTGFLDILEQLEKYMNSI